MGIWSGCLFNVFLGRCFGHSHPGGDPGAEPGHTREIISLGWLGKVSVCPRRSWWKWPGEDCLELPAEAVAPVTRISGRNQTNKLELVYPAVLAAASKQLKLPWHYSIMNLTTAIATLTV